MSRASRVDELRARGCAMDDPPYCGGFACCRDVTPSVFPHMTFLLDGMNLTVAGDAYVLLAELVEGLRASRRTALCDTAGASVRANKGRRPRWQWLWRRRRRNWEQRCG